MGVFFVKDESLSAQREYPGAGRKWAGELQVSGHLSAEGYGRILGASRLLTLTAVGHHGLQKTEGFFAYGHGDFLVLASFGFEKM